MKAISTCFVLLTIGTAHGSLLPVQTDLNEKSYNVTPLENRNGWVNPEDLTPMPQCISQQDQSAWLSAMSRCTSKQCTRHFGVICTHHQWLTQLSCLSTEFSPEIVSPYLPLCSRSVLAKAQLFEWIHTITGRTWLVNVGDANGLQILSPRSLTRGYAALEVIDKAPTCLTDSVTSASMEPFEHVIASCGFTSDTRHTGNADRPWEYREAIQSIVSLDSETAGYDLTGRTIAWGDYFDKKCFCDTFRTDTEAQLCPGPSLASTKERLWLNATCGPESMPANWTDELQTTTFAYIPTRNWRWPQHRAARVKKVTRLTDHCTTDACNFDSDGYCKVERAVDRACVCLNVSYDDCKGSCRNFEARINFVNWLHDLCGNVEGWHGLPKHWRRPAAPTPVDMIPWRWNVKPCNKPDRKDRHWKVFSPCASTGWKLGSGILVNLATLLAILYGWPARLGARSISYATSQSWLLSGLAIAAVHILANLGNSFLVQAMVGCGTVSVLQLTLFWCSMPRLTWLMIPLTPLLPFRKTTLHMVGSFLVSETILQTLSAFPVMQTVNYGLEHNFYRDGMARLYANPAAQYMYAGALMWLIIIVVSSALLLLIVREAITQPEEQQRSRTSPPVVAGEPAQPNENWIWLEDLVARYRVDRSWGLEGEPLFHTDAQNYGTLPTKSPHNRTTRRTTVRLIIITTTSSFLLWVAQWFFWAGFIGVSSEEFCPPNLEILTAIWIAASVAATTIGTQQS